MPKKQADVEDLDRRILAAIAQFDGVSTVEAISSISGMPSTNTISARFRSNPALLQAAEEHAIRWIEGAPDSVFMDRFCNLELTQHHYERILAKVYERLDKILLRTIESFDGIPVPGTLSTALGNPSIQTVIRRFSENPALSLAAEERAIQWIGGLEEPVFLDKLGKAELTGNSFERVNAFAYERLDAILLRTIESFEGIPSQNAIAKAITYATHSLIWKRFCANPALSLAAEERAIQWIGGLEEPVFLDKLSKFELIQHSYEQAKAFVYERLDAILLRTIESFDGIPFTAALSKLPGFPAENTLSNRFKAKPALLQAAKERTIQWIGGLEEPVFLDKLGKGEFSHHFLEGATAFAYERLDAILLRTIESFEGIPSVLALSKIPRLRSRHAIQRRLESNPALWLAYQAKHGLTPDQAVELALERGEQSESAKAALDRRLRNLSAFREMSALIRCFGDLLQTSVSCVSLYPDPLAKAAADLGLDMDSHHVPMAQFRAQQGGAVPAADTVILHGLHRLSSEALTLLFQAVNENHGYAPAKVIATYSPDHFLADDFPAAITRNGFTLLEAGTVAISPPPDEALNAYGVAPENLERMRRKLEGEFRVLVLETSPVIKKSPIPALLPMISVGGAPRAASEAMPIDVPVQANQNLEVHYLPTLSEMPSEQFLVRVMCGGREVALIGFDVDRGRPKSLETEVYPGAPAEDYRKIAHRLASSVEARKAIGVRPDRLVRADLRTLQGS